MTVPEHMANQTERVAAALANFIATTPEDRLNWKPDYPGAAPLRSALEQVSECVGVNQRTAKLLRGETVTGSYEDPVFTDGPTAQKRLLESGKELAEAIRALSDADLTRVFNHPRAQIPGDNLIMMWLPQHGVPRGTD